MTLFHFVVYFMLAVKYLSFMCRDYELIQLLLE